MRLASELLPLLDLAGAWLFTYLLHSTVLLGLALLATRWLGSRQLALQESLLRVAVVGGLLTTTLQVGLQLEPAAGSIAYPASAVATSPVPEGAVARALLPDDASKVTTPVATRNGEVAATMLPAATTAAGDDTFSWLAAGVVAWLLGGLLLSGRLALLAVSLARRLRDRADIESGTVFRLLWRLLASADVERPTRLTRSERLGVPIAIGIVGREICLPERVVTELPRDQQETVLAHELAHLERRDPMWLLVVRLVESVLFVQPLNRLARSRLQELAEYGCDDWAARHTGRPDTLARCLTEVASWSVEESRLALAPTMASRSGLGRRVRRLLAPDYSGIETRVPGWSRPLAAAALTAVILAVPGFSVWGQEEAPEAAETLAAEAAPVAEEPTVIEAEEPQSGGIGAFVPGPTLRPAPAVSSAPSIAPGSKEVAPFRATLAPAAETVVSASPDAAPSPSPTASVDDEAIVRQIAVAPRVVQRVRHRQVVRVAPQVVVTVDRSDEEEHEVEHDHDLDRERCEREMEELEEEMEALEDELEATLEGDLEVVLDGLEEELDQIEEAFEEAMEGELDLFEEALEREIEAFEFDLEAVEEELEREFDRLDELDDGAGAEAAAWRAERLEEQLDRLEESTELIMEQLDDELDRVEERFDERLERRFDPAMERQLEARIEAMTDRLEIEAERLEELARDMAFRHAVDGVPRLTSEDRERLRAEARRIAVEARPSAEELNRLRQSVRELSSTLAPSAAELEEMRQALAEELGTVEERLRRALSDQRRELEALRQEGGGS